MIDKKINETIDTLIKKIKDNNLASIKLSNKTNTIEILISLKIKIHIYILKITYLLDMKIKKKMLTKK